MKSPCAVGRTGFQSGEFETCPSWVPVVDDAPRGKSILLKTHPADRFDHSTGWPAKVRNVSRLGSQIPKLQAGFELAPACRHGKRLKDPSHRLFLTRLLCSDRLRDASMLGLGTFRPDSLNTSRQSRRASRPFVIASSTVSPSDMHPGISGYSTR